MLVSRGGYIVTSTIMFGTRGFIVTGGCIVTRTGTAVVATFGSLTMKLTGAAITGTGRTMVASPIVFIALII